MKTLFLIDELFAEEFEIQNERILTEDFIDLVISTANGFAGGLRRLNVWLYAEEFRRINIQFSTN